MTTAPALPRSLYRWAEPLAALDAALAVQLGPMLHVLDELITRLDDGAGATGEPDGYDGTSNRGTPDRMLMSEWVLADEVPLEFVRRAAENELSYLRRAYQAPAPSGRLLVVIDAGPDQLGPGRLVQLAALVVLARKALASGAELAVRVLQGSETFTGTVPQILNGWLRARSPRPATADQLSAALAEADSDDRVWLLVGQESARFAPEHRRTVRTWVTDWSGERAREITVRVGNATTRVPLPEARTSVAALRGEGLLARRSDPTAQRVPTTGRGAVFGSADTRLLWRGEEDDEVYGIHVSPSGSARPRRYRTTGAVLAAASLGRRIVLAVSDGSSLRIRVVGKKLARVEAIDVALSELGLDETKVRAILEQPLQPLYLYGGSILLELDGVWWNLEPDQRPYRQSLRLVGPGPALDSPRLLWDAGSGLVRLTSDVGIRSDLLLGVVFGQGAWRKHSLAWSADTRIWMVAQSDAITHEIGVSEGERVLGLCEIGSEPALVVVTAGGIIVRHVTPRTTRTWTRWSGPAHYDLHPTLPWLARTTEDRITVGALTTGETLVDIRGSA